MPLDRYRRTLAPAHTVRIEEEAADHEPGKDEIDDPLFGMWREREDMADVEAYA